jgi:two-component system nitrogen regulation response regulator GlnG
VRVPPLRERLEDIPLLLRHALDQSEAGRWIELSPEAERRLLGLDFTWPGNVRHLEQLAARLSLGGVSSPVTAEEVMALMDRGPEAPATGSTPSGAAGTIAASTPAARAHDLSSGLPSLLEDAERSWLEEALRVYPDLTRAELAARLKISESALYKKLRQYGLVKG